MTFPTAAHLLGSVDPVAWKQRDGSSMPSESFTTALFALYLLSPRGDKTFPVRTVVDGYKCKRAIEDADLSIHTYADLDIEKHGAPDLMVRTKSCGTFHIENKPWACEGIEQFQKYRKRAQRSGARFCVLISCGNSQDKLWRRLRGEPIEIILWEEILLRMDEAKFFLELAPEGTFEPYYKAFVHEAAP